QALVINSGKIAKRYNKQKLPNYSVFDEVRYFSPGKEACIVTIKDVNIAISICEDLWHPKPIAEMKAAGAQLVVSINASPYAQTKITERSNLITQRAKESGLPIIYVNTVGGQDELVFDGTSMILDGNGEIRHLLKSFKE